MHTTTLLLSAMAATAFASPLASRKLTWKPADGTTTTCDSATTQYLAPSTDEYSSLIQNVCGSMMSPCAFPKTNTKIFCTQVLEYSLNGTQSTMPEAEVTTEGEASFQATNWKANFTVTPAKQTQTTETSETSETSDMILSKGVMWSAGDCVGYFTQLLSESAPKGCAADTGVGAGKLTVGGDESLKGTVFSISFVDKA